MPLPAEIATELQILRDLLVCLPVKPHSSGFTYPFETFVVDDEWVERPGTIQGSVNHLLEILFGSRNSGNPIEFKTHGPGLVAVVDVSDLQAAARHALPAIPTLENNEATVEGSSDGKRVRTNTAKRNLLDQEAKEKEDAKKQKLEAQELTQKMRSQTEEKFTFDPEDLQDADVVRSKRGAKPNLLLDLLTIPCEGISNPTKKRWRCSADGCSHSAAWPRSKERVLPHSMECEHLSPQLREMAASAADTRSLSAQFGALAANRAAPKKAEKGSQPSVYSIVKTEGRE
ncbi:hypothetical protein FRC07_002593 [Ceratobasidium sp. 392]|nr:hypothetical protein FRC07_002593 [Ceratobasidium sp. 392]